MGFTLPSGTPAVEPPRGLQAICRTYGAIVVQKGKIIGPPHWESAAMVVVSDFPGIAKRLYVNRVIVSPLREALRGCLDLHDGYNIQTIGCFSPRVKRGNSEQLSLHSWGVAVDINADNNPRRAPLTKDIPDAWIEVFKRTGWMWGGDFPTPDPMHFQWASGY